MVEGLDVQCRDNLPRYVAPTRGDEIGGLSRVSLPNLLKARISPRSLFHSNSPSPSTICHDL